MTEKKSKQHPYRSLGFQLRSLREKENESIPDVSDAVEIDTELLIEIEDGLKLPSEDILLLLISHFNLKNEEAIKLWRLAGYDNLTEMNGVNNPENFGNQAAVFILPIDSRIVYTDQAQINASSFGIVINFQQNNSQQVNQPLTVSKLGMSYENAENLINLLQKVIKEGNADSKNTRNKMDDKKNKQKDKNKWHGSQDL